MNKINFEDNTPLFSENELHDAISCVAMCIGESIKQKEFNPTEWQDYLGSWNKTHHYPESTIQHMTWCISQTMKTLGYE